MSDKLREKMDQVRAQVAERELSDRNEQDAQEAARERAERRALKNSQETWEMVEVVAGKLIDMSAAVDLRMLGPENQDEYRRRRDELTRGFFKSSRTSSLGIFARAQAIGGWDTGKDYHYDYEVRDPLDHTSNTYRGSTRIYLGQDRGIYTNRGESIWGLESWVLEEGIKCDLSVMPFGSVIRATDYAEAVQDGMAMLAVRHGLDI